MSKADIKERAGAAATATGPNVAKADSPATPDSPDGQLPPDANPPCEDVSINGADVLGRVHAYASRFICYPSFLDSIAHALWIAHTHLMNGWFTTPRLAILSPEPGSGKSRVLEITALLVPNPLLSAQSSAAFILRSIADQDRRPTILYDEIDAIFGPQARGNEDLRSMINAGYRRGAKVGRCFMERGKVLTELLETYAAVAMGGLGKLPNTIMSRSVIISMRRRAEGETVEPFQPYDHEAPGLALRDELASWAESVLPMAQSFRPELPDGIVDRHADVWGPLIAVADLAGGRWPELARRAAIEAVQAAKANERLPPSVQLLADIRACFGEADRLTTSDLLDKLLADEEALWGDFRGGKMDARKMAQMLRPYGIRSSSIRLPDGSTPKGYKRADFHDAWARYLPRSATGATSATSATSQENADITVPSDVADNPASPPCGGKDEGVAESEG